MASGAGLFVVLFLTIGVGGAVLLYLLVRTEHDRSVMDRESAEQAARKDRRDEPRRNEDR